MPAATTTTIASNDNPALPGDSVTFTAHVQSAAGTPSGAVVFIRDATQLAEVVLDGSGSAAYTTTDLPGTDQNIQAIYRGDGQFAPSSSSLLDQAVGQRPQAITFAAIPDVTYGHAPIALAATASSGLSVSFQTVGPCQVSDGATVTITSAGICSITASQNGNANYLPAQDVTVTFTVGKATQTINLPNLPAATYGADPITLPATSSAGLDISYTVVGPCSVDSAVVTITGVGVCSVSASQSGNGDYLAAQTVTNSFTIGQANQTINVPPLTDTTYGAAPITLPQTSSAGLTITYITLGPCSVYGNVVTITGAGVCAVTATQNGNDNVMGAASVTNTFTVGQANQTIDLPAIGDTTYGAAPITLPQTSSAGLTITYITLGPCSVYGNVVTITGAGVCSVTATQNGNDNVIGATSVTNTFTVGQANQSISFPSIPDTTYGSGPISLPDASSAGLSITYVSVGPCSVYGDVVTISGAGLCSITATQNGNNNYLGAASITNTFYVGQANQTIDFPSLPPVGYGSGPISLGGSSSSGLQVTYTTTGPCSVAGGVVTISGAGLCSITAAQNGNGNYLGAASVTNTFTIDQANQTITFGAIPTVTFGSDPVPLDASSSSGLDISYAVAGPCSLIGSWVSIDGAGVCSVTASQSGNSNYFGAASVTNTFTIEQANQTITFGSISDTTYGSGPIPLTASSTSGLDISFEVTGPCSVIGQTVSIDGAGVCSVTATQKGNKNYIAAASVTNTFTIDKANQTITFDSIPGTIYGSGAVPLFVVSSSGLDISFEIVGPCSVIGHTVTISGAGLCSITAKQNGNGNYMAAVSVTNTLTIGARLLTVTAVADTKTYDGGVSSDGMPVITSGSLADGDTATWHQTFDTAHVGTGKKLTPYGTVDDGNGGANYDITFVSVSTGVIEARPVTVTALAGQGKVYGTADPALAYEVTSGSVVPGDDFTGAVTREPGENAGTYSITRGSLTLGPDYDLTVVPATFTITPAPLTITASDATATYGGTVPGITPTYTGFANGDTAYSLTSSPVCSTSAAGSSAAGTYETSCSGAIDPNYSISYVDGILAILPAPLTISASDASMPYGGIVPVIAPAYAGFVAGDTAESLTSAPVCSTAATASSPVGTYSTSCSGAVDANYSISYGPGALTVTPASLTISANDQTKTYGSSLDLETSAFVASGLVNADTVSSVDLESDGSASSAAAGTYAIHPSNASGSGLANYTITYEDGTLTVGKADSSVAVVCADAPYDGTPHSCTATASGAGITTPIDVSSSLIYSPDNVNAGTVTATATWTGDANHNGSTGSATFAIGKATVVCSITGYDLTYDAGSHIATGACTGVDGKPVSGSLDLSGTVHTAAGSYIDTWTFTDSSGNYAGASGTVSDAIVKAPLTITLGDGTKTYGTAFSGSISLTPSGLQGEDSVDCVRTSAGFAAGASAGSFVIGCGSISGTGIDNYTISYVPGTLTVTPATLTVTADSKSKTYGSANPGLTYSIAGFVNGDTMGVTNDATIYHGQILLTMNAPEIKDYLEKIPSNKSKGYGKPFNDIFKDAGYDFYKIDTSLFSPAEVVINELSDGSIYHVGAVNNDVTLKSFGLQ